MKYLILTALLAGAIAFAQTTTGRISGTVTDASGAGVPGTAIVVRSASNGLSWNASTDERGFYVVPNLPVGEYSVEAEAKGFQKTLRKGFAVDSDSRLTADFTLVVGQLSEQVQVVAEVAGESVNTTSAEIARVVDSAQVDATTLNGRNYLQLITMIPGVVTLDEDQMALTTSMSTASQSVNGNRTTSNNYTVDGGFNMDAGSNATQINNVGIEFIREVKVQTANFSAEYGRMSGAQVNVTTKSGSNGYHGAIFEYLRNDYFDARNFFSPSVANLKFNNFGWTVGGPVLKNKLFFFGGQEYKIVRRQAEPVRFSIPSIAQRAGNFTTSSKIYYPGTTTPVPNKNIASLITPDGQAIANVYNAMQKEAVYYNDAVTSSNATFEGNNPFHSREDVARVDYRMSDRNTIYARWLKDTYKLTDPFGGDSGKLPLTATQSQRPGSSGQLGVTTILSPTRVNEAKFNMVWLDNDIIPTGNSWDRSTYGFVFAKYYGNQGGAYPTGVPETDVNGLTYFKGPAGASRQAFTDLSFADSFTWIHGQHSFKAGVLVTRDRRDQNGQSQYNGLIKFNTKTPNTTNVTFADALLGNFLTYTEAQTDPVAFLRFSQAEAFVMDTWKIAPRLSIEAGVRYYYMEPAYAVANNLVNFDPSTYNFAKAVQVTSAGTLVPNSGFIYNGLVRAGDGVPAGQEGRVAGAASAAVLSVPAGTERGFIHPASLFAPRGGFAWSPFANDRTTVRGGFGLYYNRPETSMVSQMMNTPPYLQTVQLTNGNLSNLNGATAAAPAPIANLYAVNEKQQIAYTMNFSMSVQRQLPKGVFAEVAYVGNLGRHLQRQPDINTPSFANYQYIASFPSAGQPSVNAYRPYLGFSSIYMRMTDSNSNYNALQAYLTKRKGDLMTTVSYTWAKALSDSSTNTDNPEDPFNRRFNYGPTTYDRRQVFTTTFNYSLPIFRHRHDLLGSGLGGWELTGMVRAQTGPQLSVTEDGITGVMRADYIGGNAELPSNQRSPNHWFNTAAFVTSPQTRRGTSGMGIITGPGLYTWDTSLRKTFRLTERFRLRLQGDATNLMNHANFRNLQAKITNNQYGQVTQAGPPRNLQFGARLQF